MRKIKFNKKTKNIVLIVLSCIMLFGAIFGLVALFRQDKTTKEINPTYSVGALDHKTGKYVETKSAIYTKDGFECQGLTTSLEFDAVVKYQLYFYSEYDEFIHTTGTLNGVFYSTDIPVYAKYARIVIIPNEDEEITLLEKYKYSKQLNVEVNKKQNFKSFGLNVFVNDKDIEDGYIFEKSNGKTLIEQPNAIVSELVKIDSNHKFLLFTFEPDEDHRQFGIYYYDENGEFLAYSTVHGESETVYKASTGCYYYNFKLSDAYSSFRILDYYSLNPNIYLN